MTDTGSRRRSDGRPRRIVVAPSPGTLGAPDPAGARRSVGHALESAHRYRRPVTLVALVVDPPADGRREPAMLTVAALARRTIRRTDGLWRDGERSMLLLLADCDGPAAEPVLARLLLRLRDSGAREVRLGRAAAAPGIDAGDLIELAHADRRGRT